MIERLWLTARFEVRHDDLRHTGHVLHGPDTRFQMIDDGQETLHVLKTIGDVTTTTTVAVGELCTRGAADDDVYVVREVRERQPADKIGRASCRERVCQYV